MFPYWPTKASDRGKPKPLAPWFLAFWIVPRHQTELLCLGPPIYFRAPHQYYYMGQACECGLLHPKHSLDVDRAPEARGISELQGFLAFPAPPFHTPQFIARQLLLWKGLPSQSLKWKTVTFSLYRDPWVERRSSSEDTVITTHIHWILTMGPHGIKCPVPITYFCFYNDPTRQKLLVLAGNRGSPKIK